MIKVTCGIDNIRIKGHAGFADYGKDIVCASVSTAINTTVNAILRINDKAITYKDDGNEIVITNISKDEVTNNLLDNMCAVLISISKQYPKNIKIEMEEE